MRPVAYARELVRLLRGARENPLILHGTPWRRGVLRGGLFWGQVLVAVGIVGWTGYVIAERWNKLWTLQNFNEFLGLLESLYVVGIAAMLLLPALNLLAYGERWRQDELLESLLLSGMDRRAAAFGAVFWPAVASFLIPLGLIGAEVLRSVSAWLRTDPGAPELRIQLTFFEPIGQGTTWALMALLLIALTTKLWLFLWSRRFVLLLVAPLAGGVAWIIIVGLTYALEAFVPRQGFWSWTSGHRVRGILNLLPFVLVAFHMLHSAGRFAGLLFFRTVQLWPYSENTLIGHEGVRFYNREVRATIRQALRQHVPVLDREALRFLAVVAIASGLCCLTWLDFGLRPYGQAFLIAVMAFAMAARLTRDCQSKRGLVIVSGALLESIARRTAPLMVEGLVVSATMQILKRDVGGGIYWNAWTMIPWMLALFNAAAWVLSAEQDRWRKRLLVLPVVAILLALVRATNGMFHLGFSSLLIFLAGALLLGLIYFTLWLWQGALDRTVRGRPWGELHRFHCGGPRRPA